MVGKWNRIVVATQCLAPSSVGTTLVQFVAELTRFNSCLRNHLSGILGKFGNVVSIEAVHNAVYVTGNHGGVATQA